jgi:Zn-finger nucleic acid-binding protein
MKCPIDTTDLTRQRYEDDIDVDQCPECGGIWLDYQELERIQESRQRDYSEQLGQLPDLVGAAYAMALARSKPEIQCPGCGGAMERREHGGCSQVMIDVCPQCRGIWLDKGEIGALEVFFERTAVETAQARSGFFAGLIDFFQ